MPFRYGISTEKNTLKILITTIIGAVVNIMMSYFLIEYIGLFAAALGTLFSFIVVFIIRQQDVKSFYPVVLTVKSFGYHSFKSGLLLSC